MSQPVQQQDQEQTTNEAEKPSPKKPRSALATLGWGIYRFFRYLFWWLFFIILLLAALIFYFTATNSGYKKLPALIGNFTPYSIEFQQLEGTLFQPQTWHGLRVRGPELDMEMETFQFAWDSQAIWQKQLKITQLKGENGRINLLTSETEEPPASEPITELPTIDLPLTVVIDNVALNQIAITDNGAPLVNIEQSHLQANFHGDQLHTQGSMSSDQGSGELQATLVTRGDYPLDLTLNATTPLLEPPQQMNLRWEKSVLEPNIHLDLSGAVAAAIALDGQINLRDETIQAALDWSDINYQNSYQSRHGKLHITGPFSALTTSLNAELQAPDLPPATLDLRALIQPEKIEDAKITLHALGGSADFAGNVDYSQGVSWDGVLNIANIDARKFRSDLDLRLNGNIRTHGKQEGADVQAFAGIDSLDGQFEGQPISGKGEVYYQNQKLNVDDLELVFAGNTVRANGNADEQSADLNLILQAPALGKIVPELGGALKGEAKITGSLSDPQIDGQFSWANLRYGNGKKPLFASKNGKLSAAGDLQLLQVNISGQAEGQDFPPLTLTASADLKPTEKAENLKLHVRSLKGDIFADGEVTYSPTLAWNIHANAKNIDPRYFAPDLDANINTEIHSQGTLIDDKLALTAVIDSLNGRWQKQKLTGAGTVKIDGDHINAEKLSVTVGNNRVQIDGGLQGNNIGADFVIDGKSLTAFYPALHGSLSGKGKVTGTLTSPRVLAQLQGRNIAFQDNKIAALNINLDSALQKGNPFNNQIAIQGISAGGQTWKTINLTTNGQFEKHRLSLKTTGGEADVDLAAAGGFTKIDSWQGVLSTLKLNAYNSHWQLPQPAPLKLSPDNISVKNFCLQDAHSGLCVAVEKAQQTVINYQIKQLKPQSFAKLIPNNINIKTALTGAGKITILTNGSMRGDANLQLTPGSVSVYSENQPPLTIKIRQATLKSDFSDRAAKSELLIDMADSGIIKGQALLSDYQKQNITGQLTINIPKLAQFKKFVPKVSDLNGNINGTMQFTGTVDKPIISGDIALKNGIVKIPEYATDLNNITLNLAAHRTGQIDITGNIGTPEGNLTTNGNLFLSPLKMNLKMSGKNMLIANSKEMKIVISPDFTIVINPQNGVNINGKVLIPQAKISLPDTSGGQSISDDVVIIDDEKPSAQPITTDPSSPVTANIAVRLGNQVYFTNNKIKIRLKGGIDVAVRPGRPVGAKGTIEVASGVYELYGQELDVQRGRVSFAGGDITNPTVDVLALREIDDVAVGASVKGPVRHLQLKLTSQPPMPDSAILSYLLFGHPPDGAVDADALLQMAASLSIGQILPSDLAEQTGLDVFDLGVSGLKAGKYLTKDLYVGMKSDFFTGMTEFLARYQFTNRFNVEATAKQQSQSIDFLYEFETD